MYSISVKTTACGSPVTRLAIPRNFTQINPVWILFGDKFALYVHDFVQNLFKTNPVPIRSMTWQTSGSSLRFDQVLAVVRLDIKVGNVGNKQD